MIHTEINLLVRSSPKLLYIPNEGNEGDQIGPHDCFRKMVLDNTLSDYQSFSFLVEYRHMGSYKLVLDKLISIIEQTRPDIILWQHIGNFIIPIDLIESIQRIIGYRPVIGYHEGDVYDRITKPLPKNVLNFASRSDVVFLVGLGQYADMFIKAGCKQVVYTPSCADEVRFGKPWAPTSKRKYDVIMIGNNVKSKIPFKNMPGSKSRVNIVKRLEKLLGSRFGVFGHGWEGLASAHGPIPYDKQEELLRESWLSIGMDHFNTIPYYFSDRLPIALLSGVAHVCSRQPSLETLFQDGEHLIFFDCVEEAVDRIKILLAKPKEELIKIGLNGQKLVRMHHTTETRYRFIIDYLVKLYERRLGQ